MNNKSPLNLPNASAGIGSVSPNDKWEVLDKIDGNIIFESELASLAPVFMFECTDGNRFTPMPQARNAKDYSHLLTELLSAEATTRVIKKCTESGSASGFVQSKGNTYQINCFTDFATSDGKPRIIGTATDISRFRNAEKGNQKQTMKYKYLFNDAPIGVFKAKIDGRITEANTEFAKLFGFADEKELLRECDDIFCLLSINDANEIIDVSALEPRKKYVLETKLRKPRGGYFWSRLTLRVIPDKAGRRKSMIGFVDNIDDRKEKELKLKQSREQLRLVTENIVDIVAEIDTEGRISFVNPAIKTMLGFDEEFTIGRHFWEFFEPQFAATLFSMFETSQQTASVQKGEFELITQDGRQMWVEGIGKPYFDRDGKYVGGVISARDVTDRKIAEKEISESESKYRSLFETSPDGIALLTLDGIPVNCNQRMLEICDSENVEQFCISSLSRLVFPKDLGFAAHIWHQLIADGFVESFEIAIKTELVECKHVEVYAKLVRSMGNPKWVLLIARDITERKNSEIELIKSNEQLRELNSTKDKFFSIISHDLKNPISAFRSLTEMLSNDFDSLSLGEINELSQEMSKASANIYKLLENLFIWSRSQTGKIGFNPEPIKIKELIGSLVEQKRTSFDSKGIAIRADVPEYLTAHADIWMVHMVLRNLVSNARKFTPKGGEVLVGAHESDGMVFVNVSDSGVGMGELEISKLFRIEFASSNRGTDGEAGTGLGLIICKEFVDMNGGSISIRSEVGKGSCVSFSLPLSPA